jgi:hypothetical protein
MQYNSDFRYDLIIGQLAEHELANILTNKRIEVKSDKAAHRTGNVFVEYASRGKPSGLATTQADYYCFEVKETFVLISVIKLKLICRKYFKTERDITGGDENTSKGILLPVLDMLAEAL